MEKKAEHGGWQEMLHGLFQKKNWLFLCRARGDLPDFFYPTFCSEAGRVPRARRGRAHSRL